MPIFPVKDQFPNQDAAPPNPISTLMTRVLYLSHCGSSIGGGERQLYYLVTHLDFDRYQPIVVCPDDGIFADQLRCAKIPTIILPLPAWRKAKSLPFRHIAASRLVHFAKQQRIQLVHTSDSWLTPYVWRVKEQLGVPAISHIRNVIEPRRVGKYLLGRMDRLIAISQQTKAPLVSAGIAPEKIDVILNCVDLSAFGSCAEKRNVLREEFPLRRFLVGMVGRIEPFKRQKAFVQAASYIAKQSADISFLIVGGVHPISEHATYAQELHQMIADLQLSNHIVFTGHRDDMPRVMQGLDLLVTASAGSVIAEAMAAGKPVVGTPIGSASEMIDNGVTGWITPLEPINQMAQKILQVAQDANLCERMGQEGRGRVERLFRVTEHVRQVQAVYDETLAVGA